MATATQNENDLIIIGDDTEDTSMLEFDFATSHTSPETSADEFIIDFSDTKDTKVNTDFNIAPETKVDESNIFGDDIFLFDTPEVQPTNTETQAKIDSTENHDIAFGEILSEPKTPESTLDFGFSENTNSVNIQEESILKNIISEPTTHMISDVFPISNEVTEENNSTIDISNTEKQEETISSMSFDRTMIFDTAIAQMQLRQTEIESFYAQKEEQIKNYETQISELQAQITSLKGNIKEVKDDIGTLTDEKESLQKDIINLEQMKEGTLSSSSSERSRPYNFKNTKK